MTFLKLKLENKVILAIEINVLSFKRSNIEQKHYWVVMKLFHMENSIEK